MVSCLTRIPTSIKRSIATGPVLALLAVTVATDSAAQKPRTQGQRVPDFYRQYVRRENIGTSARARLGNGLRVIVEEYGARPISAVTMVIGTGYADEKATEPGAASALAWWVRHHGEMSEKIALEGGALESEASAHETFFTAVLPTLNALKGLEILAGLVQSPLLEGVSLDQIRVPESMGRGHEEWLTFQGAEQRLWNLVNPESGSRVAAQEIARVPVVGAALTHERLLQFHQKHYQPGNLTIIVSGGVVRERVLAKVAEIYVPLSGSPVTDAGIGAPAREPGFVYEHRREPSGPIQCLFGYRIPGRAHPDMEVLQLIEAALAGPRGLLVYHLVQKGLAAGQETKLWPSAQGGLFSILLFPDQDKIDETEVRLLALLETIARDGLESHDLTRAKAQLTRRYFSRLRSKEQRTRILFRQAGSADWSDLNQWPRRVAGLANERVKAVASRYLLRGNLTLIEAFPAAGPVRQFTTQSLSETFDLLVPTTIDEVHRDQEVRWNSDPTRFVIQKVPQRTQASRLMRTSVLRGPEIFQEEEHSSPLIDIGFFFPGGRVQETESNQGITELMLRSLVIDHPEAGSRKAWETLEEKGTEIRIVNEPDFFGFTAQLFSRHLQDSLTDFIRWFRAARISSTRVASAQQTLSVLQKMEQKDLFSAGRLAIRKELFPKHGYGLSRYGNQESLSNSNLQAVDKWYGDLMRGVHPLVVIYGDVEGTAFLPDLVPLLSSSKYRYRRREDHPFSGESGNPRLLHIGENWVFGGVSGPAQGTRADWVLDVLTNLLRLKRFRSRKPGEEQLPSHIKSERRAFFEAGILYFGRPSPATETEKKDFFRQLAGLSQTRVTEQDLRESIVLAITQYYMQRGNGPDYVLDVARHLLAGEKPGYQLEYQTTIKALQVADLRAAAARFLGPLARFQTPVDNPDQK